MHLYKTEAVVLSSIKFRDYDEIVTLFSKDEGIIKLIVKKSYTKKEGFGSKTGPFIEAEFIYTKGKSEIFKCQEISVLNYNLNLRNRYENLQAAASMATAITQFQYPLKPAPLLYKLFASYLKAIDTFLHPDILALSFCLKLLRHEGVFDIASQCHICQKELSEVHLQEDNTFCKEHAQKESIHFTSIEIKTIYELAFSRSLDHLKTISHQKLFSDKIQMFLQQKL